MLEIRQDEIQDYGEYRYSRTGDHEPIRIYTEKSVHESNRTVVWEGGTFKNQDSGITLRDANQVVIRGAKFINCAAGISAWAKIQCERVIVEQCRFYDCEAGLYLWGSDSEGEDAQRSFARWIVRDCYFSRCDTWIVLFTANLYHGEISGIYGNAGPADKAIISSQMSYLGGTEISKIKAEGFSDSQDGAVINIDEKGKAARVLRKSIKITYKEYTVAEGTDKA